MPRAVADRILDMALARGEASCWEDVHLHDIASELAITLGEIRNIFPHKDDLTEAWFDRADQAALAVSGRDDIMDMPLQERLQHVIQAWLDALAPHRRLTREMLAYKLEPGHIHLQGLGIMRISRTVQWFREATHQYSRGIRRIAEETGLTLAYLSAFAYWLHDDSPDSAESRRFLHRALGKQQHFTDTFFPAPTPDNLPTPADGKPALSEAGKA